jgi:hypothetical protein
VGGKNRIKTVDYPGFNIGSRCAIELRPLRITHACLSSSIQRTKQEDKTLQYVDMSLPVVF